jgi:hypothetical protein
VPRQTDSGGLLPPTARRVSRVWFAEIQTHAPAVLCRLWNMRSLTAPRLAQWLHEFQK